jgi:general secretion pathway protein G
VIKSITFKLNHTNVDYSAPNQIKSAVYINNARGFTLLELLVVIVIIGLLAAYVGPKYFAQLGKSEITVTKAQIEAFEKALDTYRLDVGRYPSSEEGLAALVTKPASAAKWNGPYLKKEAPLDPWGHVYLYKSPGTKGDYDIQSYGKDGQPGGTGEDADITN